MNLEYSMSKFLKQLHKLFRKETIYSTVNGEAYTLNTKIYNKITKDITKECCITTSIYDLGYKITYFNYRDILFHGEGEGEMPKDYLAVRFFKKNTKKDDSNFIMFFRPEILFKDFLKSIKIVGWCKLENAVVYNFDNLKEEISVSNKVPWTCYFKTLIDIPKLLEENFFTINDTVDNFLNERTMMCFKEMNLYYFLCSNSDFSSYLKKIAQQEKDNPRPFSLGHLYKSFEVKNAYESFAYADEYNMDVFGSLFDTHKEKVCLDEQINKLIKNQYVKHLLFKVFDNVGLDYLSYYLDEKPYLKRKTFLDIPQTVVSAAVNNGYFDATTFGKVVQYDIFGEDFVDMAPIFRGYNEENTKLSRNMYTLKASWLDENKYYRFSLSMPNVFKCFNSAMINDALNLKYVDVYFSKGYMVDFNENKTEDNFDIHELKTINLKIKKSLLAKNDCIANKPIVETTKKIDDILSQYENYQKEYLYLFKFLKRKNLNSLIDEFLFDNSDLIYLLDKINISYLNNLSIENKELDKINISTNFELMKLLKELCQNEHFSNKVKGIDSFD